MINIYLPVYRNLEKEFDLLTSQIHIDDKQLIVYWSKIIDLILRCASEIESISKDLYKMNWWTKTDSKDIIFDSDALALLCDAWKIDEKIVIFSHYNCFVTNADMIKFKPLKQIDRKWNKNYQKLKHDRWSNIETGNLKTLIRIMWALYLLNLYYADIRFDLLKDATWASIDRSVWSSMFEVKFHQNNNFWVKAEYKKSADFDECVFVGWLTDESMKKAQEWLAKLNKEIQIWATKELSESEDFKQDIIDKANASGWKFTQEDLQTIVTKHYKKMPKKKYVENKAIQFRDHFINNQYEAILNKNQY